MTKHDNGGAAFPEMLTHAPDGSKLMEPIGVEGMSLRAYIATAALRGILSSPIDFQQATCKQGRVALAVEYADALLAELAKEGGE